MKPVLKLAQLLKIDPKLALEIKDKMEKVTGRRGVIDNIIKENEERIKISLEKLSLKSSSLRAKEVFQGLISQTQATNDAFDKYFGKPRLDEIGDCQKIVEEIKSLAGNLTGFYLKKEKAVELLSLNPPQNILSSLGYKNIDQLLAKEDIFEIFCALRFAEDDKWLNQVFFKPYESLTQDDFEQRDIQVRVLPKRWLEISQNFLKQKLHHMSHLKELGVIFVLPISHSRPGEILYLFFMTLHYLFEVDWHSKLFEKYSLEKEKFGKEMINALKVEVSDEILPQGDNLISWRIMPKYLAKHNPKDFRIFEPHISPEAWHYTRASQLINKIAEQKPELALNFWLGLDFVGDLFTSDTAIEDFVSFSLYDNGISLLNQSKFESRYSYHQTEALWNQIFIEYFSQEELDKFLKNNFDKGYLVLNF